MAVNPQKQAAKKFREYWTLNRPGSERSGCQQYWNMLLRELFGQTELESALSRTPDGKKLAEGLRAGLSSSGGEVVPSLGDIKSLAFSIFGVKGARNVRGASVESELVKRQIEKTAQGILDARALYSDSSLADLYDPLTMPLELRKAHAANDAAVLKAYGWPTDLSEPEIVSRLFDMYARLTQEAGT